MVKKRREDFRYMIVICVTGLRGAGKSLVAEVGREFNIPSVEMSAAVIEMMKREGKEDMDIRDFAKEMRRKKGNTVFANVVVDIIKREYPDAKAVIVSGVRGMYEVETFKRELGRPVIIAITADADKRFERVMKRNRNNDPKTWDAFIKADAKDKGFGVEEVIDAADYTVENNGTVDDAKERIRHILEKILKG